MANLGLNKLMRVNYIHAKAEIEVATCKAKVLNKFLKTYLRMHIFNLATTEL